MPGKPRKRCLICGKLFEIDVQTETAAETALWEGPPQKTSSFCPLCEAKIKKEATDTLKEIKPL